MPVPIRTRVSRSFEPRASSVRNLSTVQFHLPGITYKTIADVMTNCVEEIFYKLKQWLEPNFATYGNEKNTFSSMYKPVIYDYIFHKARRSDVMVWTNWFELPFFKTLYNFKNVSHSISLSDHEAITSTIHVWR